MKQWKLSPTSNPSKGRKKINKMKYRLFALFLYTAGAVMAWFVTHELGEDGSFFEAFMGFSSFIFASLFFVVLIFSIGASIREEVIKRFPQD